MGYVRLSAQLSVHPTADPRLHVCSLCARPLLFCSTSPMAAARILQNALKKLAQEPTEGFTAELCGDNLFTWHVYVEGPKDTPYEGGVFKLLMTFPEAYPMEPPKLQFLSRFWHPNVYPDGKVCLSILHSPGNDPMSGELPEERWLPTQTVNTIVLSLISMLGEPNFSSPANVDASVQWRNDLQAFKRKVRDTIVAAKADIPDHIKIPHPDTDPTERERAVEKMKLLQKLDAGTLDDFGDDDGYFDDEFDEDQFYDSDGDGFDDEDGFDDDDDEDPNDA